MYQLALRHVAGHRPTSLYRQRFDRNFKLGHYHFS